MLSALLKEQSARRAQQADRADALKREAVESASRLNRGILATVNKETLGVYAAQKAIEKQTLELETQTKEFAKQTAAWIDSFDKLEEGLRQLGDLEGWAENVEKELATITATLEYVARNEEKTI